MQLALFDLDHTLIPFDSARAWSRFLAARGVLDAGFEARYLDLCRAYVAGRAGVADLHRMAVAPLGRHDDAALAAWLQGFEAEIAPALPATAHALVRCHRGAGDLCVLVTATSRLVAEPFARLFGLEHLLATEPARAADGRLSGEIAGLPCHGAHKPHHVQAWLAARGLRLADFGRSFFYSDAASDLPLLQAVTDPVAVRPDARLRAHALAHGWPVLEDGPALLPFLEPPPPRRPPACTVPR